MAAHPLPKTADGPRWSGFVPFALLPQPTFGALKADWPLSGSTSSGLKLSAAGLGGGRSPPIETASSSGWNGAGQRVVEETFGSEPL